MLPESVGPTVMAFRLKQVKDTVNLESDLIGKYVDKDSLHKREPI